jgi:hypothetical protein
MKKFIVSVPVDYVDGYLRTGHREMIVEADSELEAKEKILNDTNYFIECSDVILDNYEINDVGDCCFENMEILENKEEN